MSKERVMEDLDALLADLHSTTTHMSSYQQQHQQHQQQQQQPPQLPHRNSGSPPPPLPPPPSQDVLDSLHNDDQPIYEPQQVQPVYVRDEISWKKLPEQGRRS